MISRRKLMFGVGVVLGAVPVIKLLPMQEPSITSGLRTFAVPLSGNNEKTYHIYFTPNSGGQMWTFDGSNWRKMEETHRLV